VGGGGGGGEQIGWGGGGGSVAQSGRVTALGRQGQGHVAPGTAHVQLRPGVQTGSLRGRQRGLSAMEVINETRADRRTHARIRRAYQRVEIKFAKLPVALIASEACQVEDARI